MKRHEAIAALIEAAKRGDVGGARAAMAEGGIGPDDVGKGRKTALIHAIERNKMEMAHYLRSAGASLEHATAEGRRPLHYAVGRERVEMVRFLLAAGADPMSGDLRGRTPAQYLPYFWGGAKANAIRKMLLDPKNADAVEVAKPPKRKRREQRQPILLRVARAVRGFLGQTPERERQETTRRSRTSRKP